MFCERNNDLVRRNDTLDCRAQKLEEKVEDLEEANRDLELEVYGSGLHTRFLWIFLGRTTQRSIQSKCIHTHILASANTKQDQ